MFGNLLFREARGIEKAKAVDLFETTYDREIGFVPRDALDPEAHHLVAVTDSEEVVATLRLLGAESRPFSIESFVPLDSIISPAGRPGLLDHFAIRPDFRRISKDLFLQFAMLKLAYEFAKRLELTDLLLYSLPTLKKFYSSAHFIETGLTFPYPGFGREMSIMRLDLASLPEKRRDSSVSNSLLATPPRTFQLPRDETK